MEARMQEARAISRKDLSLLLTLFGVALAVGLSLSRPHQPASSASRSIASEQTVSKATPVSKAVPVVTTAPSHPQFVLAERYALSGDNELAALHFERGLSDKR